MKKILSLALLLLTIFAAFVFIPARAEEEGQASSSTLNLKIQIREDLLERIPSPDVIKDYRVIKKEGGALWGIRKDVKISSSTLETVAIKLSDGSAFEKILSPDLIRMYNKVTKVGASLWGVPKEKTEVKSVVITPEMAACVSAAIDKKDTAVKGIVATSSLAVSSAIDARNACQKEALKATSTQAANLRACVEKFQIKNKEIVSAAKTAQQAVWTVYQADLKVCRPVNASSTKLMIEDGGNLSFEALLNGR